MADLNEYKKYENYVKFIKEYSQAQNAATGSKYDSNANVENKNVATLQGELHKGTNIGIRRKLMIGKLTQLNGEESADQYITDLDNHIIYTNDETHILPYCVSITMYPFLFNGLITIGGTSTAPTTTKAFCGAFINLIYMISAQFAGAVATPEFIMYLDYFLRKDYGENYSDNLDKIVEMTSNPRTVGKVITDYFEQVVHSINDPAGTRNFQSVFWNIAYFDKPYFESIFENFIFPDGKEISWKTVSFLQGYFMKWFRDERKRCVKTLTFPVETMSMLNNGKTFEDMDTARSVAEIMASGHEPFIYTSESADSLASCCYTKDTKVLIKDSKGAYLETFEEVKNHKFDSNGYKIFNNGKWSKGKLVELPNRKIYKITTSNNKIMYVTDNHRNNCLNGMKYTKDLTTNDYIMFNSSSIETYPEKDENLTYEQGFAVGSFLGDGSFDSDIELSSGDKVIYGINYSLSESKKWIIPIINKANLQLEGESSCTVRDKYNNVIPVSISSKNMVAFIQKWTNWFRGTYSYNKTLNMDCVLQSYDFRKGIIDGWVATNGNYSSVKNTSGSLRGYTASSSLLECMECVATSIGYITKTEIDDRTDKPVFRGEEYNKNYPVYSLLFYNPHRNRKTIKDVCIFHDNSYFFRINSIEEIEYNDNVFCFEMEDFNDDKFTLPNGIHNYNCRLRNELTDNTFSYTLGAGGVATGSKGVITIMVNRVIRKCFAEGTRDYASISKEIEKVTKRVHMYLNAWNEILKDLYEVDMLPIYKAGYISLEKQFLTVGINGLVEGAEYLGMEITSSDEDYQKYVNAILKPIYNLNKADKTDELMFNTEMIPAENVGVKNAKWDREDEYYAKRECYNSYFYIVEDEKSNIVDRFKLHGKEHLQFLDGGSAYHINLKECLDKDQYLQLMKMAITSGCNYFTFNVPDTICNDCGTRLKGMKDTCPCCGSSDLDYETRIIGYRKRESKYSLPRQKEASKRVYF